VDTIYAAFLGLGEGFAAETRGSARRLKPRLQPLSLWRCTCVRQPLGFRLRFHSCLSVRLMLTLRRLAVISAVAWVGIGWCAVAGLEDALAGCPCVLSAASSSARGIVPAPLQNEALRRSARPGSQHRHRPWRLSQSHQRHARVTKRTLMTDVPRIVTAESS